MIERIKRIMEKEGFTSSSFADHIGISRSSMNHILNGRNNPSLDVLMKILHKHENINSDWLLFGKLPMYKGEKTFLQTSLFDEVIPNPPESTVVSEYSKEMPDKSVENELKSLPLDNLASKQTELKKIAKIMILYSDNTFESFSPENQ